MVLPPELFLFTVLNSPVFAIQKEPPTYSYFIIPDTRFTVYFKSLLGLAADGRTNLWKLFKMYESYCTSQNSNTFCVLGQ